MSRYPAGLLITCLLSGSSFGTDYQISEPSLNQVAGGEMPSLQAGFFRARYVLITLNRYVKQHRIFITSSISMAIDRDPI